MAGLDLPVEPRKRTVFVIDAPNARHPDAPLLVDRGFYLRPERGGQWITATVPEADSPCDPQDFEPDLHLFEEVIWEQLYARAPGFDAVKVVRHWVGHYAYNRLDQNAILGPHPALPNLYLMNGFSGHGLQQAPAVGRGIAEHLLTGSWQSSICPISRSSGFWRGGLSSNALLSESRVRLVGCGTFLPDSMRVCRGRQTLKSHFAAKARPSDASAAARIARILAP